MAERIEFRQFTSRSSGLEEIYLAGRKSSEEMAAVIVPGVSFRRWLARGR